MWMDTMAPRIWGSNYGMSSGDALNLRAFGSDSNMDKNIRHSGGWNLCAVDGHVGWLKAPATVQSGSTYTYGGWTFDPSVE